MAVLASLAFLGFQAARNRLKDKDLAEDFPAAIQHDQTVAKRLQAVAELYPFHPAESQEMTRRLGDKDRRAKAITHLQAARDAEAKGLQALDRLHRKLDASP